MTRGKPQWRGTGRRITDANGTYAANEEERKADPSQRRWRIFLGPQNVTTIFTVDDLYDLEDIAGRIIDYVEEQEKAS
jgi:hypothetical protein